tara:strand:+ start:88052 stop:89404 length:1353 start_codon:yes stop_codon:yes gene_type:complete
MAAVLLLGWAFTLQAVAQGQPQTQGNTRAWIVDVEGAIGPATADHMIRALGKAEAAGAGVVILRIDTPGGLDLSMRKMIKSILASPVPVVTYVAPGGARAASAGTYLLYASHVAAMAPGTNLGAATPVQVGGPGLPEIGGGDRTDPQEGTQPGTAMERKIVNDAVAYIESLAQLRGRNAQWARKAVTEGASLSAADALADNVIDLVAESERDLLQQLDGRVVTIDNKSYTLQTAELALYTHPVDWRSEFLSVITNPNIAYVLMLVGIYGLIIEFYNPGIGVPGVLGALCLITALYAFQVLPISYAGLGLIMLGIGLMTAEAFAPSFGVLGLGGIAAFVVGSIMLMDTELPGYQIAMPMIAAFTLFSVAVLVFALGLILKARRQALVSGVQRLVGSIAPVERVQDGVAWVRLDGELWEARSPAQLAEHDVVCVDSIDGLTLHVTKSEEEQS